MAAILTTTENDSIFNSFESKLKNIDMYRYFREYRLSIYIVYSYLIRIILRIKLFFSSIYYYLRYIILSRLLFKKEYRRI